MILDDLLENNKRWASSVKQRNPDFFRKCAAGQSPRFLWIGCADSRVPATRVTDLQPGDLFVHRNIANLVPEGDLSSHAVIQFAVESLGVSDIIVCGHTGCGGVRAAYENQGSGLIEQWLRPVRELCRVHAEEIESLEETKRLDRLCEINVVQQVLNVCRGDVVQRAWLQGQPVTVHGLLFRLDEGILQDLRVSVSGATGLQRLEKAWVRGDASAE
ncbi:MAG: carbonate dehydratase [Gammaproteobacteria bacterium]